MQARNKMENTRMGARTKINIALVSSLAFLLCLGASWFTGSFGFPWDVKALRQAETNAWMHKGIKTDYITTYVAVWGDHAAVSVNLGEGDAITSVYAKKPGSWQRIATYLEPPAACQFVRAGVASNDATVLQGLLDLRVVRDIPIASSCVGA